MVDITATIFKAMIQDSAITDANAEYILDQGINRLNGYGADLPNLSGTAGSKSVSVESREAGNIYEAALLTYYEYYKGQENVVISGITTTVPNMVGNAIVENRIRELARQLSEMDVGVV